MNYDAKVVSNGKIGKNNNRSNLGLMTSRFSGFSGFSGFSPSSIKVRFPIAMIELHVLINVFMNVVGQKLFTLVGTF